MSPAKDFARFASHPFSTLRPDECLRVFSHTFPTEEVRSTIFTLKLPLPLPSDSLIHQGKEWRYIPRFGDMCFSTGDTIIIGDQIIIPMEVPGIPIPIHPLFRVYIRRDVKEMDFVNLRDIERNVLLDWQNAFARRVRVAFEKNSGPESGI